MARKGVYDASKYHLQPLQLVELQKEKNSYSGTVALCVHIPAVTIKTCSPTQFLQENPAKWNNSFERRKFHL